VKKAQEVESIYFNMFKRNTESWLGYLNELPERFSGYRFRALISG
jgi:hypothetical protein